MSSHETRGYWGGEWHQGEGGTFGVNDPSNGEEIAQVTNCTVKDVSDAVVSAADAFKTWSKTNIKERSGFLLRIKDAILCNKEKMAIIITEENGKPKSESVGEVVFAASFFEWFSEEARRQYGETIPSSAPNKRLLTIRQPAGVAALITPWNFPIAMLARKVAAALAAGCTCVVKPAEDTPLTALFFAKVCQEAGVPKGVVNVVPCSRSNVEEVGKFLAKSTSVAVLSFTGSTRVGQILYSLCGDTLKKVALELGGNAPFILFPSADIDVAVAGAMASKFRNSGQTCVTANRFFIHASVHDEFVSKFSKSMDEQLLVGSGLQDGVNQGPLINERQLKRLQEIVDNSVTMGAKILRGGKGLGGLFYAPTLLTDVTPEMPVFREEIFGPVAAVAKFETEGEVVEKANDVDKGLAGFLYTNDVSQAWRVSEALDYGMIGINEGLVSTCEAPFGGTKSSGFGKEGSRHGIDEYSYLKYICFGNV